MNLVIRPHEGIGPIDFGMSRDEVRRLFDGEDPRSKQSDSSVASDLFPVNGVLVHYGDDETVEAIEVGMRGEPTLFDARLLNRPMEDLVTWMRTIDPRLEVDDVGFTSFRFGIGAFAPQASKVRDAIIEGIIVFKPGYYD